MAWYDLTSFCSCTEEPATPVNLEVDDSKPFLLAHEVLREESFHYSPVVLMYSCIGLSCVSCLALGWRAANRTSAKAEEQSLARAERLAKFRYYQSQRMESSRMVGQ